MFGNGSNANSARFLEVFRNLRIVEVVHFVHHADSRVDDGKSTEGTSTLAKAQAKMQQGLGVHNVEHALVTTLVTTMGEDHVVLNGRIEANGSNSTSCHDETVYEYHKVTLGSAKHGSDGGNHLETAKESKG